MDISGYTVDRIVRASKDFFASGNDANFQVRGDVYPSVVASHVFQRKGHVVEWRYGDYVNLWISRTPLEITMRVSSHADVVRLKDNITRHGLLCVRLTATGSVSINHLWQVISWCCQRGFRLEHRSGAPGGVGTTVLHNLSVDAILRKPFETLDDVEMDL